MGITVRPKGVARLQALAAVGQPHLMRHYDHLFATLGQPIAQVLLSAEALDSRQGYNNAAATFNELFALGVIPIVNENDSVNVSELRCVRRTAPPRGPGRRADPPLSHHGPCRRTASATTTRSAHWWQCSSAPIFSSSRPTWMLCTRPTRTSHRRRARRPPSRSASSTTSRRAEITPRSRRGYAELIVV